MAYCRITHTSNGNKAIDYVLSGKPHHADRFIKGRVISARGINCTVVGCRQQMRSIWRHYHVKNNQYHVQRLIISFDPQQLSYKSEKDRMTVQRIGDKVAKTLFPHHQSIVVEQADGKNHVMHLHIVTSMTDFDTGHAMSGRFTSWYKIQPKVDRIVRGFHNSRGVQLDPEAHKPMFNTAYGREPARLDEFNEAEYHMKKRGAYSWSADIKARCDKAITHSWSWKVFIERCHKLGVTVNAFRKNGKLKKRTSYSFKDKHGKIRHIRSPRLGTAYNPQFLTKKIFPSMAQRHFEHEHEKAMAEQRRHEKTTLNPTQIEHKYPVEPVMAKMTDVSSIAMPSQIQLLPKMADPKTAKKARRKADTFNGKFSVIKDVRLKQSWFSKVLQAIHNRIAIAKKVAKDYVHRANVWIRGHSKIYNFVHTIHEKMLADYRNRVARKRQRQITHKKSVHRNPTPHRWHHSFNQPHQPHFHGPTEQGPTL